MSRAKLLDHLIMKYLEENGYTEETPGSYYRMNDVTEESDGSEESNNYLLRDGELAELILKRVSECSLFGKKMKHIFYSDKLRLVDWAKHQTNKVSKFPTNRNIMLDFLIQKYLDDEIGYGEYEGGVKGEDEIKGEGEFEPEYDALYEGELGELMRERVNILEKGHGETYDKFNGRNEDLFTGWAQQKEHEISFRSPHNQEQKIKFLDNLIWEYIDEFEADFKIQHINQEPVNLYPLIIARAMDRNLAIQQFEGENEPILRRFLSDKKKYAIEYNDAVLDHFIDEYLNQYEDIYRLYSKVTMASLIKKLTDQIISLYETHGAPVIKVLTWDTIAEELASKVGRRGRYKKYQFA